MSSDSEQSNDSIDIIKYFIKVSSVSESFVAKRTRNVDKKKFVESEYRFRSSKFSQSLDSSQNTFINSSNSKRRKSNDSQKFIQLIASSTDQYELQKMNNSNLNFEFQFETSSINNSVSKSSQQFFIAAKTRKFTFNIHKHFTIIQDAITDVKRLKCNLCFKDYVHDTENLSTMSHLIKTHEIIIVNRSKEKKTIYQIKIETIFSRQFELEKQRKDRQLHELQIQTIDKKMLEFLYLR